MGDDSSALLWLCANDLEDSITAAVDDIVRLVPPAFNLMTAEVKSLKERKAALAVYSDMIDSDSERGHKDSMPSATSSTILKLNVGGKDINVRKSSIMPRTSSDSLFGVLASGRWDNHLTKDQHGRIFLDIDPEWIEVVINVLRDTGKVVLPCVATEKECGFRATLAYYNLRPLLSDFTIDLSEASAIGPMNDLYNREVLHSFLRPELTEEKPRRLPLKLLYRRSKNASHSYHYRHHLSSKCQGKGNTLTVIEDMDGDVFGCYAEGEWNGSSPIVQGKKNFFFCLTGKTLEKYNPFSAKTPTSSDLKFSQSLVYFGADLYILNSGQGYSNAESHIGSIFTSGTFAVKEFEIYQIESVATIVDVNTSATATPSTSGETTPNPPDLSVEVVSKAIDLGSKITIASLQMTDKMSEYNKTIVARLRGLAESVCKAERELLMEILLVRQLTSPASRRDIKAGLQRSWEATVAGVSAINSITCGIRRSDIIKELLLELNVTGAEALPFEIPSDEKISKNQTFEECEEVISFNVGGTIIAVLKSTLLRQAPDSTFASRVSDRWPRSGDDVEDGHICLVSNEYLIKKKKSAEGGK